MLQPIIDLFTEFQNTLFVLGPIVAVCGVGLWFAMQSLSGVLPEQAQAARGWVQRILIGAAILGLAAPLIAALIQAGGGAPA